MAILRLSHLSFLLLSRLLYFPITHNGLLDDHLLGEQPDPSIEYPPWITAESHEPPSHPQGPTLHFKGVEVIQVGFTLHIPIPATKEIMVNSNSPEPFILLLKGRKTASELAVHEERHTANACILNRLSSILRCHSKQYKTLPLSTFYVVVMPTSYFRIYFLGHLHFINAGFPPPAPLTSDKLLNIRRRALIGSI